MALLLDPKTPVRFVPADEQMRPEHKRVVYLLKAPTVWDRIKLDEEVAKRGGRRVAELDVYRTLRAGIERIYGETDSSVRAATLEQIDELIAARTAFVRKLLGDGYDFETEAGRQAFDADQSAHQARAAALAPVEEIVLAAYPRYARMAADFATYPLYRGYAAARLLLVGWENGPAEFSRGPLGVADELLELIPEHHAAAIGAEADRLLRPTEAERKNSASPSPGAEIPAPSTAENSTTPTTP